MCMLRDSAGSGMVVAKDLLPRSVKPSDYKVTIDTDLDKAAFEGTVEIKYVLSVMGVMGGAALFFGDGTLTVTGPMW